MRILRYIRLYDAVFHSSFAKPAGSLFGQSTTGTQAQPTLFGNTAQQPQTQPQQGTSLFGNAPFGQQQPQSQQQPATTTGSSLFGSTLGQQQQQPQQQITQPSLFGGLGQSTTQQANTQPVSIQFEKDICVTRTTSKAARTTKYQFAL